LEPITRVAVIWKLLCVDERPPVCFRSIKAGMLEIPPFMSDRP
jgi:hypothetical protein